MAPASKARSRLAASSLTVTMMMGMSRSRGSALMSRVASMPSRSGMAAVALDTITGLSPVPVLEVIDAGARSALAASHTKRIGIIATPSTIASQAYVRALRRLGGPEVYTAARACPLFVPLVEEGWLEHPATRLVAHVQADDSGGRPLRGLARPGHHHPGAQKLRPAGAFAGVHRQ